jgi:hypothetical protein
LSLSQKHIIVSFSPQHHTPSVPKYKQKLINKSECIWSKFLTKYIKFVWLIFTFILERKEYTIKLRANNRALKFKTTIVLFQYYFHSFSQTKLFILRWQNVVLALFTPPRYSSEFDQIYYYYRRTCTISARLQ